MMEDVIWCKEAECGLTQMEYIRLNNAYNSINQCKERQIYYERAQLAFSVALDEIHHKQSAHERIICKLQCRKYRRLFRNRIIMAVRPQKVQNQDDVSEKKRHAHAGGNNHNQSAHD